MSRIFLGKPFHWLVVIIVVACGWFAGWAKLHVKDFNLFALLLLVLTVAALVAVIRTSRPGERVTREPLEDDDDA